MGSYKFQSRDFLKELNSDSKLRDKYSLTEVEAKAIQSLSHNGFLDAALTNALLGTARGKATHKLSDAIIRGYMSMFTYTEQFNRRATALAAFRMYYERAIALGEERFSKDAAFTYAMRRTEDAINKTQGDYAATNRPALARGNLLQYTFMFKQHQITTVEMIRNMSPKGQLYILAMLLLVTGVKGIPFSDDLMDLIDTVMQKLGLKRGSVEGLSLIHI